MDYKEIPLTQGKVTLVSCEDYERFGHFKYSAVWRPNTKSFYAIRNSPYVDGKRHTLCLAREILGLEYGDPRKADHRFHDTLDNRRIVNGEVNLRIASLTENARNAKKRCDNTSGYKGVSYVKRNNKWEAKIAVDNKDIWLGYFDTPELAYAAYCLAATKYFGQFAFTGAA